ncbi:MAG TPA: tetratricopeptide repeat protein [Candidatus Acidoferrales bacterium]|nr:tetratricopeptide repeat protein [Candidatus Acidoferrales bacterium]
MPPLEAGIEMRLSQQISLLIALLAGCACVCFAQATPAPPQTPSEAFSSTYNPKLAAHDMEVGKFYQKRGDLEGAIARYKDALLHKPNYAEPCLLLGQAYEQKNDAATAIRYYREYLKILPDTSESKKVRKRIAELQEKGKKNPGASSQSSR